MTTTMDGARLNGAWRPWTVRLPALACILVLHVVALIYTGSKVEPPLLPSVPIELVDLPLAPVTMMPEQAPPEEEVKPEEEAKPEEMKVEEPVPAKDEPPPQEMPPVAAEPPPPEPPSVEKVEQPEPPAPKRELAPPPKPKPEPIKPPQAKPKPVEHKRPDPPKQTGPASPILRAPVSNGPPAVAAVRSGPSAAEFGVLVSAALRRNLTYPASASGAGAVGVVLTIGPSGRTISVSIASSSGSSAFDAAVRQAALAIQVPPPPDGRFTARTTVRFRQP